MREVVDGLNDALTACGLLPYNGEFRPPAYEKGFRQGFKGIGTPRHRGRGYCSEAKRHFEAGYAAGRRTRETWDKLWSAEDV